MSIKQFLKWFRTVDENELSELPNGVIAIGWCSFFGGIISAITGLVTGLDGLFFAGVIAFALSILFGVCFSGLD